MMKLADTLRRFGVALLCLAAFAAQAKETFRIGEPAPEFRAGRWLNGEPVEGFKPGQIYVLEFWATWCGPCIAAMPHLSELARKHAGKVTMIGVNIQEKGDDLAKIDRQVDRFMAQGCKAMQYPVCRDTPDKYLTQEWYERSGLAGIPATIVVDGKGRIAWLGNPVIGLDKALDQLLAGNFNYEASSADAAAKARRTQELTEVVTPVSQAVFAKDWTRAMALIEAAVARDPKYAGFLTPFRYMTLLHVNEDEAYAQTLAAVEGPRKGRDLASIVAKEDGLSKRMYELAARAVDGETDPSSLQARATLSYRLGEPAKAVELQKQLIGVAKEMKITPTYTDALEEDLKKFETAAAEQGASTSVRLPFRIGQKAPELRAGTWVKGPAVSRFEPGQIYVLEFWATWCGPCKAAMPHITELARRHAGKVTFIGVNVQERTNGPGTVDQVRRFVESMGEKIGYPNCVDSGTGNLDSVWYAGVGAVGLPQTIIVDGKSNIAWVGGPSGIDAVVDALLAGTFDYEKTSAAREERLAKGAAMYKVGREYQLAYAAGDWAKVVAVIDAHPQQAAMMALPRYMALVHVDPVAAFAQLKTEVAKKSGMAPLMFDALTEVDNLPAEMYEYVIAQLGDKPGFGTYESLARSYYRTGNTARALELQTKLVEAAKGMDPTNMTPEYMDRYQADLKKYQGK